MKAIDIMVTLGDRFEFLIKAEWIFSVFSDGVTVTSLAERSQ
jgi:hypothetical protein